MPLGSHGEYFIDVFDGTDWGIDLPRDEEVEKAAVLALRVLVEDRFQESTASRPGRAC